MVAGQGAGRLTGGNLSLVAALMGTPYEIETDGKILFLEDVGESPYRVDRMLCTMKLAGKFDNLAGVLLGQFTRRKNEDTSGEKTTINDVLETYFSDLDVPVLMNYPMGHHRCNVTLPVGILAELKRHKRFTADPRKSGASVIRSREGCRSAFSRHGSPCPIAWRVPDRLYFFVRGSGPRRPETSPRTRLQACEDQFPNRIYRIGTLQFGKDAAQSCRELDQRFVLFGSVVVLFERLTLDDATYCPRFEWGAR